MKLSIEAANVEDQLARELHRQYRAAAKAMGVKGPKGHDHGVRDCGAKKFKYFQKRAALLVKRATCITPDTWGQAEENLNALILIRRTIVMGENNDSQT